MNCGNCGNEIPPREDRCPTCGVDAPGTVSDIWDDPIWADDETVLAPMPSAPGDQIPHDRRPPRPPTAEARPEAPAPEPPRSRSSASHGDPTSVMDAVDLDDPDDLGGPEDLGGHGEPYPVGRPDHDDDIFDGDHGRSPMPWVPPVGTGLVGLGWALLHLPEPDSVGDPALLGAAAGSVLIGAVLVWGFNRTAGALGALAAAVLGCLPMLVEIAYRAMTSASSDASTSTSAAASAGGALLLAAILAGVLARGRSIGAVAMLVVGGGLWIAIRMSAADAVLEEHRWAQAALAGVCVMTLASGLLQSGMVGRRGRREP